MKNFFDPPNVYLVGAGPGDPELLTLKGKRLLQTADVVIYDQLANPELLNGVSPQAEKINVGKQAGRHTLPQEKINRLLLQKAQSGKRVVRLKGGDPFVFGRGGEEAEYLAENGCRYEIVPGVTSATAVPAYAGIPVTHRQLTSTVTFITGHEATGSSRLNWAQLAPGPGTLVFLMGLGNLPEIVQNLIQFGRPPQTPAAVISHGTHNDQRTVLGTLTEIVEKVHQASLKTPAIIIVGEVVALRKTLQWFENRPLFQQRVLVTRAEEQSEEFAALLRKAGAVPIRCPLIRIQPRPFLSEFFALLEKNSFYSWMVFTSVNGVKIFFDALFQAGKDVRMLGPVRIAAIGGKTAKALKKYGLQADVTPSVYRAEALAEALIEHLQPQEKILLPRAAQTRDCLVQRLAAAGSSVDELALYETQVRTEQQEALFQLLPELNYITFASSSAVQAFCRLVHPETFREIQQKSVAEGKPIRIAAIGPITAQTAQDWGLTVDVVPIKYTLEHLVEAITEDVVQRQTNPQ